MNKEDSPTIRLILVRHGETDYNKNHRFQGRINVPLNKTGQDQARALALALKNETLTAIYSSPLSRSIETASHIRAFHSITPLIEENGLMEMDLGEFDGMDSGLWAEQNPDFLKVWLERPSSLKMPGGESLEEVQIRALSTINRITQAHPTKSTLLLSSHNFVNLTILCHASQIPLDRFREIKQGTASFSVLYKEEGGLRVETINQQSHLDNI